MRRFTLFFAFAFTLALTVLVYRPGLSGSFVFDDTANILANPHVAIQDFSAKSLKTAAFSSASGPLSRPISMISFAANHAISGFDPYYFKATNIAIHLANGIGIFLLSLLLLRVYRERCKPELSAASIQWISLACAAAWLLHPLNLTSILYVVQRMTSLSALFSIYGIALYVWGRIRICEGKGGTAAVLGSVLIFTPLAALCKENGGLLPLLLLIVEVTLFRFAAAKDSGRRFLIILFIIVVAIPAVAAGIYLATHTQWLLATYESRHFTLLERLMTEARVIWFYLRLIVIPSISQIGLFHDDIAISHGLLNPPSTLLSILGLCALLLVSFLARKKAPLISFGILFFLGGHLLESTIFSLEIAHEHRNYLPSYGILIIPIYYLLTREYSPDTLRLRQIGTILFIGLLAINTFLRATAWSNPYDLAQTEVRNHPDSARNNSEIGNIYASIESKDPLGTERNYLLARAHFEKTIALDPNYTNGLFGLIILSAARGKEIEPAWIKELKRRLEQAPFHANTGDKLIDLVNCQIKQFCKFSNAEMQDLLRTPLKNPTVFGSTRAMALSALSYYQVNVERNYDAALVTMTDIVAAAPTQMDYRFNLLQFLIALQDFDEAKKQLQILKQLDKFEVRAHEISSYENAIIEQEKSKGK